MNKNKKDVIISSVAITLLIIIGILCDNFDSEISIYIFILAYSIIVSILIFIIYK